MKKFIFSLVVIWLASLFCFIPANAYLGYNVGPRTYTLTSKYHLSGGEFDGEKLMLDAGETAIFDFYMPFNPMSMSLSYTTGNNCNLTVKGVNPYTVSLNSGTGREITIYFSSQSEKKGERVFSFSATGAVSIDAITFHKEMIETVQNYDSLFLCEQTDTESAIETAVLVDQKASMLMVNGSRRYLNNQDPTEVCLTYEGKIYLPAHTLARALGYYIEDMPERNYLLMRHDSFEYYFTQEGAFYQDFGNQKNTVSCKDVRIYKNGSTYLPLRFFAEATGRTVRYRDGIAVIDDKFTSADIIENETVFAEIQSLFAEFYPAESGGLVYYVAQNDQNASDSGDGSFLQPFKTLSKAAEVAQAGDTVIVREGVYRETLVPAHDGTATQPIVFQAAEGEEVILSANESVNGFALDDTYGEGIYKASVSWDLGAGRNQVFYNGTSLHEARYPNGPEALQMGSHNENPGSLWPVAGDFSCIPSQDETENLTVTSDTLLNQQQTDYWKGAYFVSMRGYCWTLSTAQVASSTTGSLTLTNPSAIYWDTEGSNYQFDGWEYGYLAGHINALDEPEEWILQNGQLYLIPPIGVTPETMEVEVKKRQLVADLSERQYVQLKGFTTIGGSIRMNESEMCLLDNLSMSYLNHYIISQDQHSGYIDNAVTTNANGAPQRGEVGIYIGGRDNIVINNRMSYAAAAAVYGVGRHFYIENNIIDNCGYAGSYVGGLYFSTEAWKDDATARGGHGIYANTIYNAGRAAMTHIRAAYGRLLPYLPEEIAFNDFHDSSLLSLDAGITYEYYILMGHEKLFTRYHHNYVYHTLPETNPYCFGIYHDGGTQNIDTYNNIIFSTQEGTGFTDYIHSAINNNSRAYCPQWNNRVLTEPIVGGKASLTEEHFPNRKPFYAGAYQEKEQDYLVNYNIYTS